jgi:hypothetical protein
LAKVLGENWQDEYFIWDCAAGTGNLLNGLVNKYHIYASTLDKQDVEVMHDRIDNGANLLHDHIFQFDFLNDEFKPKSAGGKLPNSLYSILQDPKKRKKLLIYINPPYAEATTARTVTGTGENKAGVAKDHKIRTLYREKINGGANEVFALFMTRIYVEIPDCMLAQFSKMKFIQGTNFTKFRQFVLAQYKGGFVVPADTFDNVKGKFPIGFTIWDTSKKEKMTEVVCDVYNGKKEKIETKTFYGNLPDSINKWIIKFDKKNGKDNGNGQHLGYMGNPAPDFQNNKFLCIETSPGTRHVNYFTFTYQNLIQGCIYFAVRHCIEATWLNDRDQFLYPNNGWEKDTEFQNDSLVFTLFHGQNRISSKDGTNHWIPFTEQEVNAKEKFESDFMANFIKGKLKPNGNGTLYEPEQVRTTPLEFSVEANAVFEAGRKLWQYYHQQPKCNVNASLYDIKEHFQGRNEQGKMHNKSSDETYMHLINDLREKLKQLTDKIALKVYEYSFLKA